jgi:hypothetical protein
MTSITLILFLYAVFFPFFFYNYKYTLLYDRPLFMGCKWVLIDMIIHTPYDGDDEQTPSYTMSSVFFILFSGRLFMHQVIWLLQNLIYTIYWDGILYITMFNIYKIILLCIYKYTRVINTYICILITYENSSMNIIHSDKNSK